MVQPPCEADLDGKPPQAGVAQRQSTAGPRAFGYGCSTRPPRAPGSHLFQTPLAGRGGISKRPSPSRPETGSQCKRGRTVRQQLPMLYQEGSTPFACSHARVAQRRAAGLRPRWSWVQLLPLVLLVEVAEWKGAELQPPFSWVRFPPSTPQRMTGGLHDGCPRGGTPAR